MIIDYGMGNLASVRNALISLGGHAIISKEKKDFKTADAFILPGVGSFGQAMENIKNARMLDELNTQVLVGRKPFLGICLGMQLIAESSEEGGGA